MKPTDRQRARQARARANWDPSGPLPIGDQGDPDLLPGPDETLDAFAGHWRIFQLKKGHRYSTDDLLGAWFTVDTLESLDRLPVRALDLGTGIGSVGLFLLWKFPDLHLNGVEAQTRSLDLARRSARFNGVASRVQYIEGDLRSGDLGRFDLITGSPPYWNPADGTLSDGPQKGPCRFEFRGGLEDYCQAAERSLSPGGIFVLVFDGRQHDRLERAAKESGLGIFRLRDVVAHQGREPLILVAAMSRSSGLPMEYREEPPLILREDGGRRSAEFRALRSEMGLPPGPV